MIPLKLLNSYSKFKMGSETDELEIQQVVGRKNEEAAWSVINSRLVIDLYRGYGSKAVTKKVLVFVR